MPEPLSSRFPLQISAIDGDDLGPEAAEALAIELRSALTDAGAIRIDDLPADAAPEGTRGLDIIGACMLLVTVIDTAEAILKVVRAIRYVATRFAQRRQPVRVTLAGVEVDLERVSDEQLTQMVLARSPVATAPVRSALIIANADYEDSRLAQLRSPGHDAEALTRVLGDPAVGGFEVDLLHDADERTIRRRIAAFFADRDRDDLLVLHFSCHGVKDTRGRLHLAARDTDLSLLGATALPAAFVNDQIAESQSQRVVLILDCCYSGAFVRGASVRGDSEVAVSDEFGAGSGRIVLTASKATEYSFEGGDLTKSDGRPSAFTSALVTGLETGEADLDSDGEITVDELYDYVYRTVRASTPGQAPLKWSFGAEGGLVIAKSRRTAALPQQIAEDLRSHRVPLRMEAVKALALLLDDKRQGLRDAASSALADLLDNDDSVTVRRAAADVLDGNRRSGGVGVSAPARPVVPEQPAAPISPVASEHAGPPEGAASKGGAPQPVSSAHQSERARGALKASGWLVVLSVLFGAVGMVVSANLGYWEWEVWADRWIWIIELTAAILLLSTRKVTWGSLLVGALTWEWLWLPVFFHSYLLDSPWGIYLLTGNLLGLAALVCAVVALAPRWHGRGVRVVRLLAIAAVAALSVATLFTAADAMTRIYQRGVLVRGTIMDFLDPFAVQNAWWFVAVWAAAILPVALLATENRRALSFVAVGWLLGGTATAVLATASDGAADLLLQIWLLIAASAATAYWAFRQVAKDA